MYRDFTNEEMERLLGYVQDEDGKIDNQLAWGTIDFFADLAQYSDLDIDDYVNDIDSYHKKLIDAENMTAKKIKQIFKAVHEQDEDTLTNIDIINGLAEALDKYMFKLKSNIAIGKKGFEGNVTEPLALSKKEYLEKIKNEFQFVNAKKCAEIYDAYRDGDIKKVKKYLEREVNDLTRNVADFGGQPGANVKKIREEIVVDLYRLINPDSAKKFDELFDSCADTISELDRYNIMYLVYTAEEPFKSLFIKSLGAYKIGEYNDNVELSHNDPNSNKLNFDNDNTWLNDPYGAYHTFFHECGHAIDYNAQILNGYFSEYYDSGAIYDAIYGDIIGRIRSEISEQISTYFNSLDDSKRSKYIAEITDSIVYKKGDVSHFSDMTERTICKRVIRKMCFDLREKVSLTETENIGTKKTMYKYISPSDIYGGATDKTITGYTGHDLYTDYDKDGKWDYGEGYFYPDKDGMRTKYTVRDSLSTEAWAEYFSNSITGNKDAIEWTKEYLPNTVEKFGEIAKEMEDKCY